MIRSRMKDEARGGASREEIHELLDGMTERQVEEVIRYLTWILETP